MKTGDTILSDGIVIESNWLYARNSRTGGEGLVPVDFVSKSAQQPEQTTLFSREDKQQIEFSHQPNSSQHLDSPSRSTEKRISVKELMNDAFTPIPIQAGRDQIALVEGIVDKMKSWAGVDSGVGRVDSNASESRMDRAESSKADEKKQVEIDFTILELIDLEENFSNSTGAVVQVSLFFNFSSIFWIQTSLLVWFRNTRLI
jgi:hypothetical protein